MTGEILFVFAKALAPALAGAAAIVGTVIYAVIVCRTFAKKRAKAGRSGR